MEYQVLFNIAFTLLGAAGMWVMKFFYDKLHELTVQDQNLADKVHAIDLLVAGQYVKRDVLERFQDQIMNTLNRIESKLDGKVDKE